MQIKRLLPTLWLGFVASYASAGLDNNERVHTDRYTLVAVGAQDEQRQPLSAVIAVSLGKEVVTVGDAINEVLKGSGYRWTRDFTEDQLFDKLPLPEVARELGPLRVKDAIETLVGDAWVVEISDLYRTVRFQIKEGVGYDTTTRIED